VILVAREVVVYFGDIGGIVEHHYSNFLVITYFDFITQLKLQLYMTIIKIHYYWTLIDIR